MDIALLFRSTPVPGQYPLSDIALSGVDLQTGFELESAVVISLFTERRAEEDDEPLQQDRRGWWGDTFSVIDNDRIGSRLWLLERQKETQQVANLAKLYCDEALQWLIDDDIAESINVETEIVSRGTLAIRVEITAPQGSQTFDYSYVWNQA